MEQQETYKTIPFATEYKVGINGKIFSEKTSKILKPSLEKNKYYSCVLNNKTYRVHRIVAITFIPNLNNYPCVNHKNGIKTDNRVDNLEWCTYRYNIIHASKSGLHKSGVGENEVFFIRDNYKKLGRHSLANIFNLNHNTIYKIATGRDRKTI